MAGQQGVGRLRLNGDQAHMVRDDVMQLAGDPGALTSGSQGDLAVTLRLGPGGTGLYFGQVRAPGPAEDARHPGRGEHQHGHEEVVGLAVAWRELRGDDPGQEQCADGTPHPRAAAVHHGEIGDRGPQRERCVAQRDLVVSLPGEADDQEDRDWPGPAPDQGKALQDHQDVASRLRMQLAAIGQQGTHIDQGQRDADDRILQPRRQRGYSRGETLHDPMVWPGSLQRDPSRG